MKTLRFKYFTSLLFTLLCLLSAFQAINAQGYDRIEKGRMKDILNNIKNQIKKNYYDPNFHGIDIEARFKKSEERLDQVTSVGQAFSVIAQTLIDFDDSHLFFIPPSTNVTVEYGWRMQMFGDKCLVTSVKPKSDAEAKGIKPGDQIFSIEGFRPSKKEFWKMQYYYNVLSKRDKLNLLVAAPGASEPKQLEVKAQIKKLPNVITFQNYFRLYDDFYNEENSKHRFITVGNTVIWRMPSFGFEPTDVDFLMEKVKNGKSLVLDLRGNGGGYVKTLERLAGFFFDKDVKIADMKGRKEMEPSIAKTRGDSIFKGNVVVLVDSRSGSAAEIFARLIQLEKRGKILGDVSAGAVMQSLQNSTEMGTMNAIFYAVSITNADVIMSDGKSIEHVGVIPDELILPTGEDLANQRDPVIVRAIEILDGKISAGEAGKFFPYYWDKD
ncbi:MAG TPA: S41 family peptidase [Pyrinomonadaceae bacterium]|jgi:C-terminal processing protease CtpA/Prc